MAGFLLFVPADEVRSLDTQVPMAVFLMSCLCQCSPLSMLATEGFSVPQLMESELFIHKGRVCYTSHGCSLPVPLLVFVGLFELLSSIGLYLYLSHLAVTVIFVCQCVV